MGRTMGYEGEMGCQAALRIVAWKSRGRLPTDAPVSFQALLIIRHVHCETQYYLIVLFTYTLYYFFKDYHTGLGENISTYSLVVQFKGKDSSQVPVSLGGQLLPPADSLPPLEKSPQKLQWKDESILPFLHRQAFSALRQEVYPPAVRMKTAISCGLIYLYHLAKTYQVIV